MEERQGRNKSFGNLNISILIEYQRTFRKTGNIFQLEGMVLNMTISIAAFQALLILNPLHLLDENVRVSQCLGRGPKA